MKYLFTIFVAVLLLSSCDVHQFPEEDAEEPEVPAKTRTVALELDFSFDLPLHSVVDYTISGSSDMRSTRSAVSYKMRHTVKIFDLTNEQRGQLITRADPIYTFTFYSEPANSVASKHRVEIDIPDGDYTAFVWSDYVDRDNGVEYYNIDDFSSIIFANADNYEGSCEWRDAFRGEAYFTVAASDAATGRGEQNIIVEMERPLARLSVISTDLRAFINKLAKSAGDSHDNGAAKNNELSDFYARMVYTGYLPSKFNMFRNKPVNSSLGISFASEIMPIDDDNACLAFDYIMVNDTETNVDAAIQILDRNDNIIAQSPMFTAPLKRSCHTEVRGRFLTTSSDSGIGIDTDFDGEYNIRIN